MEYALAVILLLALALGCSMFLGFLYVWCCSQAAVQKFPSQLAKKNKNKKLVYGRVGGDHHSGDGDSTWMGNGTTVPLVTTDKTDNPDWNRDSGKSRSNDDSASAGPSNPTDSTYVAGDSWGNPKPAAATAPDSSEINPGTTAAVSPTIVVPEPPAPIIITGDSSTGTSGFSGATSSAEPSSGGFFGGGNSGGDGFGSGSGNDYYGGGGYGGGDSYSGGGYSGSGGNYGEGQYE